MSVFFVTVSVLLSGFFFTSSDLFSPWAFMVIFVFPPFTVGEFPSLLSACGELSVVSVFDAVYGMSEGNGRFTATEI